MISGYLYKSLKFIVVYTKKALHRVSLFTINNFPDLDIGMTKYDDCALEAF